MKDSTNHEVGNYKLYLINFFTVIDKTLLPFFGKSSLCEECWIWIGQNIDIGKVISDESKTRKDQTRFVLSKQQGFFSGKSNCSTMKRIRHLTDNSIGKLLAPRKLALLQSLRLFWWSYPMIWHWLFDKMAVPKLKTSKKNVLEPNIINFIRIDAINLVDCKLSFFIFYILFEF